MKARSLLVSCALSAAALLGAVASAAAVAPADRGGPDYVMPGAYDGTICFSFSPPVRDAQGTVYSSYCDAWIAGAHVAWRLI